MDSTKDPIESMKKLLDNLKPSADQAALLGSINQALVDLVRLLETRPEHKPPDLAPLIQAIASIKLAAPHAMTEHDKPPKQWRINAPVDGVGRPTGEMTLTEVR